MLKRGKKEEIEKETLKFLFSRVKSPEDIELIENAIQDYREDCEKYNFIWVMREELKN